MKPCKPCYDKPSGAGLETKPMDYTFEHQTVKSRLDGWDHEISFQPLPAAPDPSKGGLVPYNPLKSKSQMRWMFAAANRGEVPKDMPHKWAHETPNIAHLPEKVKH